MAFKTYFQYNLISDFRTSSKSSVCGPLPFDRWEKHRKVERLAKVMWLLVADRGIRATGSEPGFPSWEAASS